MVFDCEQWSKQGYHTQLRTNLSFHAPRLSRCRFFALALSESSLFSEPGFSTRGEASFGEWSYRQMRCNMEGILTSQRKQQGYIYLDTNYCNYNMKGKQHKMVMSPRFTALTANSLEVFLSQMVP